MRRCDLGRVTSDEIEGLKSLKKRVVERLERKHHRACAYCRRPVGHYGYGWNIEHVYPKASFPEDTFSLRNFTIACVDCNRWKAARGDHQCLPKDSPLSNPWRMDSATAITSTLCILRPRISAS
ncbi:MULTISPECIES: HNH endonuclease [Ralstonia]|uniref:HNH endonuclease n=1 Tax=Ralstonia TaxID=48736 RepID=UPI0009DC362A